MCPFALRMLDWTELGKATKPVLRASYDAFLPGARWPSDERISIVAMHSGSLSMRIRRITTRPLNETAVSLHANISSHQTSRDVLTGLVQDIASLPIIQLDKRWQ